MQCMDEQLRCERALNEDLKARLHELEARISCDCDTKQINENSQEIVCRLLCFIIYNYKLLML